MSEEAQREFAINSLISRAEMYTLSFRLVRIKLIYEKQLTMWTTANDVALFGLTRKLSLGFNAFFFSVLNLNSEKFVIFQQRARWWLEV
jgi:hypothetical protein